MIHATHVLAIIRIWVYRTTIINSKYVLDHFWRLFLAFKCELIFIRALHIRDINIQFLIENADVTRFGIYFLCCNVLNTKLFILHCSSLDEKALEVT